MEGLAVYYARRSAWLHMRCWKLEAFTKNCLSYLIKLLIIEMLLFCKMMWKVALGLSYRMMNVPHLDLFFQTHTIFTHFFGAKISTSLLEKEFDKIYVLIVKIKKIGGLRDKRRWKFHTLPPPPPPSIHPKSCIAMKINVHVVSIKSENSYVLTLRKKKKIS